MTGIVGPNGCGKSNVVDAVRWVMGETSRHIRATTLEDVIFNGTSVRKPKGQTTVELIFDDAGSVAGGKFAQYAELSLRRTFTRNSDSKYYINGTHCRRRDVADIFLGTGLGANSYAVVEQGMIARLVEAKPEEIRAYVEEAAGVSQYKERRRDAENRMRHTRLNLDRVLDIREEIGKQIRKLKRQVRSAEKFKQLRKNKERLESELLLLRCKLLDEERVECEKQTETRRLDFEKNRTALREVEADAEQRRAAAQEVSDELNRMKEEHYRLGAKISREEQDIENRKKGIARLGEERAEVEAMAARNAAERERQQALLVEREQHCTELDDEVKRLSGELDRLREERATARQMLDKTARKHQDNIRRVGVEITASRDKVHDLVDALNTDQSRRSDIQGRLSSLEALQEAGLHSDEGAFSRWLNKAGLKREDHLVERIRVTDGWENAIETVLGSFIGGVEVSSLDRYTAHLDEFDKGTLVLLEPSDHETAEDDTLASKVSGGGSVSGFLGRIRIAESLDDTLNRRSSLKPHESLITRDGVWVGPNWVKRYAPGDDGEGVIVRERHIEKLRARLGELDRARDSLKNDLEDARAGLASKETERDEAQGQLAATLKEAAALESGTEQVGGSALEDARSRLRAAREDLHRVEIEREATHVGHAAAREQVGQLQSLQEELAQRQRSLSKALKDLEQPMSVSREHLDALLSRHADEQRSIKQHTQKLSDLQSGTRVLEQRRAELTDEVEARRVAYEEMRAQLQVILARHKDALAEFDRLGVAPVEIEEGMDGEPRIEEQEEKLARVQASLDRLGAINLVALEEFDELSERKQYLDSQYDDLTRALKTLEEAIHKIDRETRERFKVTFDKINFNLKNTFPCLFGGGEAALELTEHDLLTAGVSIIVRPPGKRRVAINLLSGGEKALAAAAVVFSIFEINPAPFCLLDEVDAPLDESNVEHFCELIKSMSARVQFIVITHNKISMEYMGSLIGVTMQEAGVSRLVAVDVEEAAKMATA